jgi:DNA-binding winged helix-turn-helix (wHTH) protein/tetratricopeptide (TPR) repeat protein
MVFQFNDFEIDTLRFELRRNGQLCPVEPQVFSLLLLLVENRHRVVPRDEIIEVVWAGRAVSDSAVSSRIKDARKALNDDGTSQRYIRTLHGRGFRFVAEGVLVLDDSGPMASAPGSAMAPFGLSPSPDASQVPASCLLERDQSLERMRAMLTSASNKAGHLHFLGGEAGVGKTSLVREAARFSTGAKILWGACDPLSTPRPFGPILDFVDRLGQDMVDLLQGVAPRDRLFQALLGTLRMSAQPVLMVFEDVHWADEATLDLIRFLGRRIVQLPVLMVATYRNEEVGPRHPLTFVMGDLVTSTGVSREILSPLSLAGVTTLAAQSAFDPAELHHRTKGNPFFITEILAGNDNILPTNVRDAVLARVARLSANARRALAAAAILGPRIEPDLIEVCAEVGVAHLEECEEAGLLIRSQDILEFRHELAREALQASLPESERRTWHAAALSELSQRGSGDFATLAHHAEEAHDRSAVLILAPAAARQASALRSHREAVAQYRRALRFAGTIPVTERASLTEACAYESYLTGQLEEALELRRAALRLREEISDPKAAGANMRWISRICWLLGRREEADKYARAAVKTLEPLPPGPELAMAWSNLSQLCMLRNQFAEAIQQGEPAIALARALGNSGILSHALNNVGTSRAMQNRGKDLGELEESLQLAQESGLEEHVIRAYVNLSTTLLRFAQLPEGERWLRDGLIYSTEHDIDEYRNYLLSWLSLHEFWRGKWDAALVVAKDLLCKPSISAVSRIMTLVAKGRIQARRGDPGARATLDQALEFAIPCGEMQRIGPVRVALAEAAFLLGDISQASMEIRAYSQDMRALSDDWVIGELEFWEGQVLGYPAAVSNADGPWRTLNSGDGKAAAQTFRDLGLPYETALALATCGDEISLRKALEGFERLGAKPAAAATRERLRASGVEI